MKGAATLTWAKELIEDPDSGDFYLKVYPKLSNVRVIRDSNFARQIANEIINDIKKNNKKVK